MKLKSEEAVSYSFLALFGQRISQRILFSSQCRRCHQLILTSSLLILFAAMPSFPAASTIKTGFLLTAPKTAHRTERLKIRRQRATALTSHTQTGSQRCGTASALQSFHTIHTPAPAGSRLRSHRPPEQDFHGTDRTPVRKAPPHTALSTPCAAVHRPRRGKRSLRPAAQECP